MTALAPRLTGDLLAQALKDARAIPNVDNRARVLTALAPRLTGETQQQVLAQALAEASAISDVENRVRALSVLAPHFSGETRQQLLAQVHKDRTSSGSKRVVCCGHAPHWRSGSAFMSWRRRTPTPSGMKTVGQAPCLPWPRSSPVTCWRRRCGGPRHPE